ncbi:four-domain proteases inhibitor-like [Mercenaria mercenaria]|uniref:four-domain proteases inhibitor-like n=1 Tax=Mercenaria mercenaria TaxID=6596 RepID=UPI001E1DEA11|nr:four-domain proteases inhibitor-like [Mercenaria mercenaria]
MESLFILSLLFIVSFCQQNWNGGQGDWYCSMLMNEDCTLHHLHERCGTDGITYRNMCDIGQAHCRNNVTNQLHEGPCIQSTSTTRSPEEVIHGSAIILDFQCTLLSHRECEFAYYEKICGTDGRTYPTFCEYEKARCTHRDLHVAKFGDCYA